VALVEPDRKTLLQQLHELGQVAHERQPAFAPGNGLGTVGRQLSQHDLVKIL